MGVEGMRVTRDLFSGAGGFSAGARNGGLHCCVGRQHTGPKRVEWQAKTPPGRHAYLPGLAPGLTVQVPAHDVMLASPCLPGSQQGPRNGQGQSRKHDAAALIWAWAVVICRLISPGRPIVLRGERCPEFSGLGSFTAWEPANERAGLQRCAFTLSTR